MSRDAPTANIRATPASNYSFSNAPLTGHNNSQMEMMS